MPAPNWIQHVDFDKDSCSRTDPLDADELRFMHGRDRAVTVAESNDPNANWSYDDWALCELDGEYFAFMTAGCSCPSPNETWTLMKCGDRDAMLAYLQMGTRTDSFEKSCESFAEFLRQVEAAGWTLLVPAPAAGKCDW